MLDTPPNQKRKPHQTIVRAVGQLKIVVKDRNGNLKNIIDVHRGRKTVNVRITSTSRKRNPDLIYLVNSQIQMKYYKNTPQAFVYKRDGEYCGALEKHDLKHLFFTIGRMLKEIKK